MEEPTPEEVDQAARLVQEWDEGRGTSKSQIEMREWGDATSHGRRFDRFILRTLGVQTSRPSKQSDRIAELERQLKGRGWLPQGAASWEVQLQHGRSAALAALRIWNDPTSSFRTGSFSLLFVTAWNSLAIAVLQRRGEEWRELDDEGKPALFQGQERTGKFSISLPPRCRAITGAASDRSRRRAPNAQSSSHTGLRALRVGVGKGALREKKERRIPGCLAST